jgi:hypothetical protein
MPYQCSHVLCTLSGQARPARVLVSPMHSFAVLNGHASSPCFVALTFLFLEVGDGERVLLVA